MFDLYLTKAFVVVALVSGIPLAASCVAGFVVSLLQTLTQIQEQSIGFAVRFLSVCGVFALCGGWFWGELVGFLQQMLASISYLGKMP
jgi:type III secretory pathway component EscS